jgi:hypothetical protein
VLSNNLQPEAAIFATTNMSKRRKINVKYTPAIAVLAAFLILTKYQRAAVRVSRYFGHSLTKTDTIPASADSSRRKPGLRDSTVQPRKIATIDTIRISKDSIDAPIKYTAEDSGVLKIETREFLLYGKAEADYSQMQLRANTIQYDQSSQLVRAYGSRDTSGSPLSKPEMRQGEMTSLSDSITFNLKSLKGVTKNSYYKEGEMFVNAALLKKVDTNAFFGYNAKFTTCNLDTPHFAIRSRRLKLINNKVAMSGLAIPEFEGVPVPIGLPFGIYPLSRGRSSGLMAPQFITSEDFGIGLEGLGYYKVLSDYADVTIRTNLYSYGGWAVNLAPKYMKRYHYTGGMNITFQNTKSLNRGLTASKEEFNSVRSFMINWNHARDNRARPGTNFTASVNFGSTRFNQNLLNNPLQNFQNQLTSSISYTKDWKGKMNMSVNATHNQNNNTRLVNLSLPNIGFNMVTVYPFQKKERVGTERWYEKLGIGLNSQLQNQISFYDTAFNMRRLLDTMQWGASHSIPITLSLPALGPITIGPSISYDERCQRIIREWDTAKKKVDTTIQRGFYAARQMSFGISANTRIFGTVVMKRPLGNIKAIRHEIRPSFGISYKPDMMARFYKDLQIDTTGRTIRVSQFDGGILGSFSEGKFGGISFGIDNLLELKVRDKKDTSAPDKKVRLIDGFGFTSSYNLMADSFALAPFNFYLRSNLFQNINITAGLILDPYETDERGFRKNQLQWKRFSPGSITSANIAVSTSFQAKTKDGKEKDKEIPIDPFMTPEEQQRQLQFARANPAEFTDFDIPWSLNLSYSLNYTRSFKPDYSGFQGMVIQGMSFNGDFSLSSKLKILANGFIDLSAGKIQQFTMSLSREMHCWQLSANVTPIGLFRSFSITVNPKSGILRDLRINRARTFSNAAF